MSAEATSSPGSSASHSWVHFRQRFLPAIALCLALAAQGLLLYSTDKVQIAAILFILAANCLLIAFYDWPAAVLSPYRSLCAPYLTRPLVRPTLARIFLFILSLFLAGLSFRRFGANNLAGGFWWWFAAIILFLIATIAVPHGYSSSARNSLRAWWETVDKRVLLLLLTIMLLATFYRFYRLQAVPLEMTSDHVEKILDVQDILDGQRPIFFTRNTGREMFQFYLTAAIINLTGLPNSHLALKVGTALFGLVAIPFTFLLGSLLYGRLVGLAAAFLLAISHWHVAITRVGLRFPFTAAFATPVLYFFLRALAHNRRNDWLLAGLFLGIGLHTYTAMRVLPLISAVLLALTLIHDGMRRLRKAQLRVGDSWTRGFWLNSLLFLVFVLLLLTPLLRYMTDDPASVWIRSTSRAIPETPQTTAVIAEQFLRNVYNAALMFNVRGDVVAMNTIPYEPVLGLVTGALFILGLAYLLWRLLVNRDPRSLLLLIILFFLLLPSILSLAYPGENPSVVRTGGAPPVVMIIAAVPFVAIPTRMSASGSSAAKAAARLMVIALSLIAIVYNANWYFHDYDENILYSIGNATELGAVLADFEAQGATVANAYHIPYPHWIDTRAIGINAGHVRWDNAVEVEDLPAHAYGARPRLYLVNKDDAEALAALQQMFPDGSIERYDSSRFGRDFFIFRVPEKSV